MGRRGRGIRKAAIMEIQQVVGVQTRARALALAAEKAGGAAGSIGRKAGAGGLQISCLQLRSRRLAETPERKSRAAGARGIVADGAAAAAPRMATGAGNSVVGGLCPGGGGAECGSCVSECSSNASCEPVAAAAERKNGRSRSCCLASEVNVWRRNSHLRTQRGVAFCVERMITDPPFLSSSVCLSLSVCLSVCIVYVVS